MTKVTFFRADYKGDPSTCIEVARVGMRVRIRNSNTPDGAIVTGSLKEWVRFVQGVKNGDFDGLTAAHRKKRQCPTK